jgi:hypothetical protein
MNNEIFLTIVSPSRFYDIKTNYTPPPIFQTIQLFQTISYENYKKKTNNTLLQIKTDQINALNLLYDLVNLDVVVVYTILARHPMDD